MALLETTTNKKSYTRKEDETIIKMKQEGYSNEDIAKAVGHSPASVNYRIQRVLTKVDSFDEINYKGASKAATPATPVAATKPASK